MGNRATGRSSIDRRAFLGAAGAAAGGALIGVGASAQPASTARSGGRARNVILAISDGLSAGVLSIADLALRRRDGGGSRWLSWMNEADVRTALVETTPATGVLTDSAAAATAWSIGERVNNGAICRTPDGGAPTPLFVRAKRSGRRIGLVTTASLTDATPAAMVCNAARRSEHSVIAKQMLERGLDLGIGGGARHFDRDEIIRRGVAFASDAPELRRLAGRDPDRPLLALLASGFTPHALDRRAGDLAQREAARLALEHLADSREGFCLLFENENTDEASHANDAASLLHDLLDFEGALDVFIEFARSRDDTLLIATTDHACGNPGISTSGEEGWAQLERLLEARRSFDWVRRHFRGRGESGRTAEALASLITDATGVTLTDEDVGFLRGAVAGERTSAYQPASRLTSVMGAVLANHLGVAFTGPHHTTDLVIATAMGPGSEALPARCHHTDVHRVMAEALGLRER